MSISKRRWIAVPATASAIFVAAAPADADRHPAGIDRIAVLPTRAQVPDSEVEFPYLSFEQDASALRGGHCLDVGAGRRHRRILGYEPVEDDDAPRAIGGMSKACLLYTSPSPRD